MISPSRQGVDLTLLLVSVALIATGVISIYSATNNAGVSDLATRQLIWAGIGLAAMLVTFLLPFRFLQRICFPSYFVSLILLLSVLLLGKTVSGSTSWFSIGNLRFQPSEFAKVATALALSAYLARTDVTLSNFRHLIVAGAIVLLPVGLIMMQPDFGTAIIYLAMFLPVMYWGGATKFAIIAVLAPGAAAVAGLFGTTTFLIAIVIIGVLLYMTKENRLVAALIFSVTVVVGVSVQFIYAGLKSYQQKRIDTFLDPAADPLGAGYNVLQSKVAIGSGGLFGKGYLEGTQTQLRFIPEQWTDFIFCVPGEEFGFIGAATVLFLFLALVLRGIKLGASVKNPFGSILAISITSILTGHIFINIGMSLGLLPVIGVPLPFLSYGGSALLSNMIMIGLLLNLYAHRKEY
ncbi:MAG: rod shape-determining protein RodA [Ignavibacteria bacterium]|nr:rod shape-determining protein RodA [Ignavibacteria bacterium]